MITRVHASKTRPTRDAACGVLAALLSLLLTWSFVASGTTPTWPGSDAVFAGEFTALLSAVSDGAITAPG
jgi:hypothetical protein